MGLQEHQVLLEFGATGATGAAGADGIAGANGATGADGATGAAGANGISGATGANGADGVTGADGATGATGATCTITAADFGSCSGPSGPDGTLSLVTCSGTITTTQKAWLTSGNNTLGTDYFGSFNDDDIRIATNNNNCIFDAQKQKMIIAKDGSVGIGSYDGTNLPIYPQNSLLVQRGTNYIALAGGSIYNAIQNDWAIIGTNTKGTTGSTNNGLFMGTLDDNSTNVSILSAAIGDGSSNTAINASVEGNNSSINQGATINASGDNAANTGINLNVDGDNSTNTAGLFNVSGDNSTNKGIQVNASGANTSNTGINVFTTGSTDESIGVRSYVNGSAADRNVAIMGLANDATQVNIGVSGGATFNDNVENRGVDGVASGDNSLNVGIYAGAYGKGSNTTNTGITSWVEGADNATFNTTNNYGTNKYNAGFVSQCRGENSVNVGIFGTVMPWQNGGTSNSRCFGAIGSVLDEGGTEYIGVLGEVPFYQGSVFNYGVVGRQPSGTAGGTSAPTSTGSPTANYAGFFVGDVFAASTYYYSDPSLKTSTKDYGSGLEKISRLSVKSYKFKTKEYPELNMPSGEQVGLLSSDLKKEFPELVKHSVFPGSNIGKKNVSFEAVNYVALIPVLIQAVKELDAKTEETKQLREKAANLENRLAQLTALESKLSQLENDLNAICDKGCASIRANNSNKADASILFQNIPNPLDRTARIDYYISNDVQTSSIIVYNADGRIINQFEQLSSGKGSVTINAETLAAGTYYYALFCNNKKIDTKTMVVAGK